jgi:hypothetical protein
VSTYPRNKSLSPCFSLDIGAVGRRCIHPRDCFNKLNDKHQIDYEHFSGGGCVFASKFRSWQFLGVSVRRYLAG